MKKLMFLFLLFLVGCANESDACRAVSNMGFTRCSVHNSHYITAPFYGCHDNDGVAFEVLARNPSGTSVRVIVCCSNGPFGACTIRN